jgi:penicillin-binding protein 1C
VPWLPWPGHHLLELVDVDGSVADSVRFEVRGAIARTPDTGGAGTRIGTGTTTPPIASQRPTK